MYFYLFRVIENYLPVQSVEPPSYSPGRSFVSSTPAQTAAHLERRTVREINNYRCPGPRADRRRQVNNNNNNYCFIDNIISCNIKYCLDMHIFIRITIYCYYIINLPECGGLPRRRAYYKETNNIINNDHNIYRQPNG